MNPPKRGVECTCHVACQFGGKKSSIPNMNSINHDHEAWLATRHSSHHHHLYPLHIAVVIFSFVLIYSRSLFLLWIWRCKCKPHDADALELSMPILPHLDGPRLAQHFEIALLLRRHSSLALSSLWPLFCGYTKVSFPHLRAVSRGEEG